MTKRELLEDPDSCLNRSAEDEPVFLLCARDRLAPAIIEAWAARASQHDVPTAKVQGAVDEAIAMRAWQEAHPDRAKLPD